MNEEVKLLIMKAGGIICSDMATGTIEKIDYLRFDAEKFAELIVRECIGCCEQVISDPVPESVDTWLNGGEQCIQEIKEHFGIKE